MSQIISAGNYMNSGSFSVTIGNIDLSFSRISGIGQTQEYDTYTEGGGRIHLLPKPLTSAGTITFERGISVIDRNTAGVFMSGGEINNITIHLKKFDDIVESYWIESGMVVSWELGDLDAVTPVVLIKKMKLAHTGLIRI